MKIAFLSHSAMSLYHFRMPIIKALLAKNHKVFLLAPDDEYCKKLRDEGFTVVNYELSRASLNPFTVISNFLNLKKTLKNLQVDAIQTNAHKSNTLGIIAAFFAGIKFRFAIVEGLGSFYIDNDFKSILVRFNINFLYKISFRLGTKFIFVNKSDAEFMKKLGLKDEKLCIIKSVGVNLRQFFPQHINKDVKRKFLQELNLDDKPIVLMVARALWHKGVKEFYEAASMLKNKANFILVGGVDDNKSCAPLSFLNSGHVKYLGAKDDIAFYLNLCDIFVLPSYKEGFPRTVLEAKACARACVVSDCDGCVEAIRNGHDGLYAKTASSKDLAQKIELLLDDEKLRQNLAQNAFEDAQKYSDTTLAKQYLNLYKESGLNV